MTILPGDQKPKDTTKPFSPPVNRTQPSQHSIENEPWLKPFSFTSDPNDFNGHQPSIPGELSEANSVWDEPGLSPELAGELPPDAMTWFRHYEDRASEISWIGSWMTTLLVAIIAGCLAIVGTLISSLVGFNQFTAMTIFGPTLEEVMKIAVLLWIVETCPWRFHSGWQIVICGVAGGLAFAAIENLLYIYVYLDHPSEQLVYLFTGSEIDLDVDE